MCQYRYRIWACGCDEKFLTKRCAYADYTGHVRHKDRFHDDVYEQGRCPHNCRRQPTRSGGKFRRTRKAPGPDILDADTTHFVVGKLALGTLKQITKF